MKKNLILSLVLLNLGILSIAQTTSSQKLQTQSFKAGGVEINIPAPDATFIEISNNHRGLVEVFVPQVNRLLSAYVLKNELPYLFKDRSENIMTKYALVEIPRKGEYRDYEQSDFKQFVDYIKGSLDEDSFSMKETEEEFNGRMRSLDLPNIKVKLGQPTSLGIFFSKQDVFGFGMLMGCEISGHYVKMGVTTILIRVKKRLIYIFLYAEYENFETITWLRNVGGKWSDEILKANN